MQTRMVLFLLGLSAHSALAANLMVNCGHGESLKHALAQLNPNVPTTIQVQGTCTEYLQVRGFEGLTLKGVNGATLAQPSTAPSSGAGALLMIEASRNVTVEGFTVNASATGPSGIGIGHGSTDVLLRNLTVNGGGQGIVVYERSQVGITQVTARDAGWAPLGIYDNSDVHVEGDCLFENTTGVGYHAGIAVGSAHLTIRGATIRNEQWGISVGGGGTVGIQNTTNYAPAGSTEVLIENPDGTNLNGVWVADGSYFGAGDPTAILRITNAGQPYGGQTGGILVGGHSTLHANSGVVITGSVGQGIIVMDSSQATLSGASITGGQHGGVVVGNLSTVTAVSYPGITLVGGNAVDLYCDSKSVIAGHQNFAGAPTVQCGNLLADVNEPLP